MKYVSAFLLLCSCVIALVPLFILFDPTPVKAEVLNSIARPAILITDTPTPEILSFINVTETPVSTPIPACIPTVNENKCADYSALILNIGKVIGVDGNLLSKQIKAESNCNPQANSCKGDLGIAQIHMSAHPDVTVDEAMDPSYAILWMAKKMKYYVDVYGSSFEALRRYNCGDAKATKDNECGVVYANNILR